MIRISRNIILNKTKCTKCEWNS